MAENGGEDDSSSKMTSTELSARRSGTHRIALSGIVAALAVGSVVGLAQTPLFGGNSDASAAVKRSKQARFIAPRSVPTKTATLSKSMRRVLPGRIPAVMTTPVRSVVPSVTSGEASVSSTVPSPLPTFPSRAYAPNFRQTFPSRVYAPVESLFGESQTPVALALTDPDAVDVDGATGTTSTSSSSSTTTSAPVASVPAVTGVPTVPVTPVVPVAPATVAPPTAAPTTADPTTAVPTTAVPATAVPTTAAPTTAVPTTAVPTPFVPAVAAPTGELRPDNASSEVIEQAFVSAINELRASKGLRRLKVDPELVSDARVWAVKMKTDGFISHDQTLGTSYGGPWLTLGENVGAGPEFGGLQAAFIASAKHYENLVRPNYTGIGIGVVFDGSTIFVTERFVAAP